jgi:hypothetical protein
MTYPSEKSGAPNYLLITGAAGTNDNDVIYTSGDVSDYDVHYIECIAGTVSWDISFDGVNFVADAVGSSLKSLTSATWVVTIASGGAVRVPGAFKAIRVLQAGATASNARIVHARAVAQ